MIVENQYPETYIPYNNFMTNRNVCIYSDQITQTNPLTYFGEEARIFTKGFFAGDSLTKGTFNRKENGTTIWEVIPKYSYPAYFGKIYGCEVANWGIGGEDTKSWYEAVSQDTRATDYDFAVIALGANDTRLNDISVSKDYYQRIINMFKSDVNNVKIFCCTVTPAYTETNPTFYNAYNDMVPEIVDENTDCYLIDLANYSICKGNTPYAQGHLTALGYLQQAREIGNAISYIIHTNPYEFKDVQFIGTEWHY
jgi:lysophospholipase L1-like esterase